MYKLLGFATSFFLNHFFFTEQELINTKWHSSFFMYTLQIGMTSVQRKKIDFFVHKGSKSQDKW